MATVLIQKDGLKDYPVIGDLAEHLRNTLNLTSKANEESASIAVKFWAGIAPENKDARVTFDFNQKKFSGRNTPLTVEDCEFIALVASNMKIEEIAQAMPGAPKGWGITQEESTPQEAPQEAPNKG